MEKDPSKSTGQTEPSTGMPEGENLKSSALPPSVLLTAGPPDPNLDRRGGSGSNEGTKDEPNEEGILWALEFTWKQGDKALFWRIVQTDMAKILADPEAVLWMRSMNARGEFRMEEIPMPEGVMATEGKDNTATELPEPRLVELPEVQIRATPLGPPSRENWVFVHHEGNSNYYKAKRGNDLFLVAETSVNAGSSVYHFLTPENPKDWKAFYPHGHDFFKELQAAIFDMADLLDFAEFLCEEGAYMMVFELGGLMDFGDIMRGLRSQRAMARQGIRTAGTAAEDAARWVAKNEARGMRTRMMAKVGGDPARMVRLTDDELMDVIAYQESLGFSKADIEAFLAMKMRIDARGYGEVSAEEMKTVGRIIAERRDNHQIVFAEGYDFMQAYQEAQETMLKGGELNPEAYLDPAYMEQHLGKFEGKASYLVTGENYNFYMKDNLTIGRPGGQFVSTAEEVDRVLNKANGNITIVEREMGIPPGAWQDRKGIYRVDVKSPEVENLRFPTGNEPGANQYWHPGGITSGNTEEAVISPFLNSPEKVDIYKVIE